MNRFLVLCLLGLVVCVPSATMPNSGVSDTHTGSRAFLDRESGRLRAPTRAELRDMPQPAPGPREPVRVERRDGMTVVHLPADRRMRLQARLSDDGEIRVGHGAAGHE